METSVLGGLQDNLWSVRDRSQTFRNNYISNRWFGRLSYPQLSFYNRSCAYLYTSCCLHFLISHIPSHSKIQVSIPSVSRILYLTIPMRIVTVAPLQQNLFTRIQSNCYSKGWNSNCIHRRIVQIRKGSWWELLEHCLELECAFRHMPHEVGVFLLISQSCAGFAYQ